MALSAYTYIDICDVPLNNSYAHTLYFENATEQNAYFSARTVKQFSGYAYVRRTWSIKVEAHMSEARQWRYLRFINSHDSKMYYFFITRVEYVNDSTVELFTEMDLLQTYMFDWNLKECFIERQHTETDSIGEHTVDEGLETGELINAHEYNVEGLQEMAIVIMSAVHLAEGLTTTPDIATPERFDNIFSGLGIYAVDLDDWVAFANLLENYSSLGAIDGIVSMYMYPKNLLTLDQGQAWGTGSIIKTVWGAEFDMVTLAKYTNYRDRLFGGYTPLNNKLYCYPYNFLYCTNNQGGTAEYKYERFDTGLSYYGFDVWGGVSQDAGVHIAPDYYNGGNQGVNVSTGFDYGLTLGNFPSCAWNSDTYKVWLAQNYHTLNHQGTSAVLQVGAGAATVIGGAAMGNIGVAAGGAAMAYNGLNTVQGLVAQKRDMQTQPPQARGAHSVTINTNAGKQTFTFYYKTISQEYAKIVDDFFTMYGYRINRVQKPNIHARYHYTYIKTVGCIVTGPMNADELQTIGRLFDNGLTFWTVGKVTDGNGNVTGYFDRIGEYGNNPVL